MATTTPNFGWPVPTSTDLVKDGATAIEGLGDAIDASLLDLKGGTTGQVLSKASNTDMDFSWVTDATGIPATIFDAKGDIIAATAADTASRLAVGTNGQVLTADSTAATGLKWATPASSTPTFVGCAVVSTSASQTISNATWTAVTWNSERFDTDGFHDNTTNNSRITVPTGKAGKYSVSAIIDWDNNATGKRYVLVRKNNADYAATLVTPSTSEPSGTLTFIINLAVGDYIEVFVWQNSGANRLIYTLEPNGDFSAGYLGA